MLGRTILLAALLLAAPQASAKDRAQHLAEAANDLGSSKPGSREFGKRALLHLAARGGAEAVVKAVVRLLAHKSPDVRSAALETLELIGREARSARPQIRKLLEDGSAHVRKRALHALTATSAREKADVLAVAGGLKDSDKEVRATAADCLSWWLVSARPAVPLMVAHLRPLRNAPKAFEESHDIVLLLLGRMRAVAAVPVLCELLRHSPHLVSRVSAVALGLIGSKQALPALEAAHKGKDPLLSLCAAAAIGGIDSKRVDWALAKLVTGLGAKSARSRRCAAANLGFLGAKAAPTVPKLIASLGGDSDRGVRSSCARSLGKIGPAAKSAVPALLQALKKGSTEAIRGESALALKDVGVKSKEVVSALRSVLRKGRKEQTGEALAAEEALVALSAKLALDERIRSQPSVTEVVAGVLSSNDDIRFLARSHVYKHPKHQEIVSALVALLSDPKSEKRLGALDGLGSARNPLVLPAVRRVLAQDKDSAVREAAVRTIRYVGVGNDDVAALANALKDPAKGVRDRAGSALHGLGPKAAPAVPVLVEILKAHVTKTRSRASEPAAGFQVFYMFEILKTLGPKAKAAVGPLCSLVSESWNLDSQAALALGRIGSRKALPTLLNALKRKKGRAWLFVHAGLALIDPAHVDGAVSALVACVRTEKYRSLGIRLLGALGSRAASAASVLGGVMASKSAKLGDREDAAMSLGQIGPNAKAAIPDLLEALKLKGEKYWEVRANALEALGKIGVRSKAVLDALWKADAAGEEKARETLYKLGVRKFPKKKPSAD